MDLGGPLTDELEALIRSCLVKGSGNPKRIDFDVQHEANRRIRARRRAAAAQRKGG